MLNYHKVSGDERLGHRVLAERLAKDRPVHRLVAEDTGDGLGEVAVAENRNHAKIAARGALLEAGREAQHVRLGLQRLDRKLVVGGLFGSAGVPPSVFTVLVSRSACALC